MLEKLQFYIRHSFNDLRVNGQRTLFALLCIAAGVAAIVSLQTLGVMIEDSLTGSLQESNRGDMRIMVTGFDDEARHTTNGDRSEVIADGGAFSTDYFSPQGIETIRAWFEDNYPGSVVTANQTINNPSAGVSISLPAEDTEKMFVMPYIVDAQLYPLYGDRDSEDGKSLNEMLQNPTDIVLSRNLADDLNAEVGDIVKIAGASRDFTVTGIGPTEAEGGFENMMGSLFGYYYLDMSARDLFDGLDAGADTIYVKLADPDAVEQVNARFEQRFPYLYTHTTTDLEEQNTQISDAVGQLVIVMGLISLLIGGIGIVNTMLVIVSRRTTEVAVLKTIGLEGEQVTVLFLVEAVLMGILGSILGIAIGWVAAYAIKGVAESFLATSLTFRPALTPALNGFVVGIIVTTIFGFMPTLAAGQVRPNLVLRPSDTVIPKAGRARSFAALLFVMMSIALVAQPMIGSMLSDDMVRSSAMGVGGFLGLLMGLTMIAGGIFSGWARRSLVLRILRWLLMVTLVPALGAAFGYAVPALLILFSTFIIAGVLYVVLWVIIWLIGRFFPTWRMVDLRIALRSMLATKGRNASTLLALVIGVFTLSLITMLATAITNRFEELMENEVGGNVIVFAAGSDSTLDRVAETLDEFEGVNSYATLALYDVELVELYDASLDSTLSFQRLLVRTGDPALYESDLEWSFTSISGRSVDSNLPELELYAGRQLEASDATGWNVDEGIYPPMVIAAYPGTVEAGVEVGDLVTYRVKTSNMLGLGDQEGQEITFQIAGMIDYTGPQLQVNFGSPNYAPLEAFQAAGLHPDSISAIVDVEADQVRALRQELNAVPGVFVLETKLLNDLVTQVIDQFTSFPILVAALSLAVGGIVIANSVALATLERRREIAIMKAVGVQRERVLGLLLLEYGIMGLIGGLIGVGLGGIGLLLMLVNMFGGEMGRAIPYVTAFELMGLCVLIALGAAVLTAWRASGEKPLNVLRHE